jgi:hypothetical protein
MAKGSDFNPADHIDEDGKITVENVNHPGKTSRVGADRYLAMYQAFLKALPKESPGLNQSEIREAVKPYLSEDLYPGGQKVGWWAKSVQLDLEAKGILVREDSKPLRWHLVKS